MRTPWLGVWSLFVSACLVACGDDVHTADTADSQVGEVEATDGTATDGTSETVDGVDEVETTDATETIEAGETIETVDGSEVAETTDTTDTAETTVVCTPQRDPDDGAFDDHSVLGFESVACLEQWAGVVPIDPLVL